MMSLAKTSIAAAITAASLAGAAAIPSAASAQSYYDCRSDQGGRTVAGALIGGAVGAVAGNQIARSGHQPCPPGYVARVYDDRYYNSYYNHRGSYYRNSSCRWEDRSYRDAYGNWVPQQVQVCR